MRLPELSRHQSAIVLAVEDAQPGDPIARRLRDLGFVNGESIRLVTHGPVGGDPLLVQIGYTRFALRRSEAQRVSVQLAEAA